MAGVVLYYGIKLKVVFMNVKQYQRNSTNFSNTLPPLQSELAIEIMKDKYNFEFLTLGEEYKERALHLGLMEHLQKFLVELGVGFAFVGSQYHLKVGNDDYYLDCLFYHLKLRSYIICELLCDRSHKSSYVAKSVMCC